MELSPLNIYSWKKVIDKKQYKNEPFYPKNTDHCNYDYYIEYQKEIEDLLIKYNYIYDLIEGSGCPSGNYTIFILCNGIIKEKSIFYDREWISVYKHDGCFWYIPYIESEYKILENIISKEKDSVRIDETKDFMMKTTIFSMKIAKIYNFTVISYNSNFLFGFEDYETLYGFLELKTITYKYEDIKKKKIKMTLKNIKSLCFNPKSYSNMFNKSLIYKIKNIPDLENIALLYKEWSKRDREFIDHINKDKKIKNSNKEVSVEQYLINMKKKAYYLLKCAGLFDIKKYEIFPFQYTLSYVFNSLNYSISYYKKDDLDSYIILNYLLNNNLKINDCEICDSNYVAFRDLEIEYICEDCIKKVDNLVRYFDDIIKDFTLYFKVIARDFDKKEKIPSLYYLSVKKYFNEDVFVFYE